MKHLACVILILVGALIVIPSVTTSVHANPGTGTVCILPSKNTSCPILPFTFGNLTAGSSLTIGVFVQASDDMGGFDIYVKSDNTVLNPTSAAFGGLILSPSLSVICVKCISPPGSAGFNTRYANVPGVVMVQRQEGE